MRMFNLLGFGAPSLQEPNRILICMVLLCVVVGVYGSTGTSGILPATSFDGPRYDYVTVALHSLSALFCLLCAVCVTCDSDVQPPSCDDNDGYIVVKKRTKIEPINEWHLECYNRYSILDDYDSEPVPCSYEALPKFAKTYVRVHNMCLLEDNVRTKFLYEFLRLCTTYSHIGPLHVLCNGIMYHASANVLMECFSDECLLENLPVYNGPTQRTTRRKKFIISGNRGWRKPKVVKFKVNVPLEPCAHEEILPDNDPPPQQANTKRVGLCEYPIDWETDDEQWFDSAPDDRSEGGMLDDLRASALKGYVFFAPLVKLLYDLHRADTNKRKIIALLFYFDDVIRHNMDKPGEWLDYLRSMIKYIVPNLVDAIHGLTFLVPPNADELQVMSFDTLASAFSTLARTSFPAITYLMCMGSGLAHSVMSGTLPDLVALSKAAYRASRDNYASGLIDTYDMLEKSLSVTVKFIKGVFTGKCDSVLTGSDLGRLRDVMDDLLAMPPLASANDHAEACAMGDKLDECNRLTTCVGANIKITCKAVPEAAEVWKSVQRDRPKIVEMWNKFNTVMRASSLRQVPYSMSIFGGTSLGKSYLTKCVLNHLTHCAGLPSDSKYHYYYSPGHKYMDGYAPWKLACILDDAGAIRSRFLSDGDPMVVELLQMINSTAYLTPQAELESKAVCFFNSPLLLVTTNYRTLHAGEYFHNEAVVLRRLRHHLTVVVVDAYSVRDSNGKCTGVLDSALATAWCTANPNKFPPFWKFTITKYVAANEVTTSGDVNISGKFEIIKFGNVLMREVDQNVFRDWLDYDFRLHVAHQASGASEPHFNYCTVCGLDDDRCTCQNGTLVLHSLEVVSKLDDVSCAVGVGLTRFVVWAFFVNIVNLIVFVIACTGVLHWVRLLTGFDLLHRLVLYSRCTIVWFIRTVCMYLLRKVDLQEAIRFDELYRDTARELSDVASRAFALSAREAFVGEVRDAVASPELGSELATHAHTVAKKLSRYVIDAGMGKTKRFLAKARAQCEAAKPFLKNIALATTVVVVGLGAIRLALQALRSSRNRLDTKAGESETIISNWNKGFVPQPYQVVNAHMPNSGRKFRGESGPRFVSLLASCVGRLHLTYTSEHGRVDRFGQVLVMNNGIFIVNTHTIAPVREALGDKSVCVSVIFSPLVDEHGQATTNFTKVAFATNSFNFSLCWDYVYDVPERDISLIRANHQRKGLDDFLGNALLPLHSGYIATRGPDGNISHKPVETGTCAPICSKIKIANSGGGVQLDGLLCDVPLGIVHGDSGAPAIYHSGNHATGDNQDVALVGIVLGNVGHRTAIQRFCRPQYDGWRVKLDHIISSNLSRKGLSDITLEAMSLLHRVDCDNTYFFGLSEDMVEPEVHHKSSVAYPYIGVRPDGQQAFIPSAEVYGSLKKFRSASKSAFRPTPWAEELRKMNCSLGSFDVEFLPADCKNPWAAHRICFGAMMSWHGEGVPRELAIASADMFLSEIADSVSQKRDPYYWLRPFTLEESINGIPGIANPLDFTTGGGFGYEGPKAKFFDSYIDDSGREMRKCCSKLQDDVDQMNDMVCRGFCPNPIFTAHLKDEVRTRAKVEANEIRVINGSPLPFTIVCRMYFLGIITFMQCHKFETECYVGMNVESSEWTLLWEHVHTFIDGKRMDADQPNFDKSQKHEISYAANVVMTGMMVLACRLNPRCRDLWTHEAQRALASCLYAVSGMSLDFFGTLVRVAAIMSSGNSLTVQKNCVVGSLYTRSAWIQGWVDRGLKNIPTFRLHNRQGNYGDDLILETSGSVDWFDHQHLSKMYNSWSCGYTLANKQKIGPHTRYTSDEELQFVKRTFVKSAYLNGGYLAPLEFKSIVKSLLYYAPSRTLTREMHLANILSNVSQSCLAYGPEVHNELKNILSNLQDRYISDTNLHITFVPFFGEGGYVQRWFSASGMALPTSDDGTGTPDEDCLVIDFCADETVVRYLPMHVVPDGWFRYIHYPDGAIYDNEDPEWFARILEGLDVMDWFEIHTYDWKMQFTCWLYENTCEIHATIYDISPDSIDEDDLRYRWSSRDWDSYHYGILGMYFMVEDRARDAGVNFAGAPIHEPIEFAFREIEHLTFR